MLLKDQFSKYQSTRLKVFKRVCEKHEILLKVYSVDVWLKLQMELVD